MKFNNAVINTVGDLKKLLERFPNKKSILLDNNGNTWPPEFYNWGDAEDDDIDWPIAIR